LNQGTVVSEENKPRTASANPSNGINQCSEV